MRGPLRAHGIPHPRRIALDGNSHGETAPPETPAAVPAPPSAADPAPPPELLSESAPTPWSDPVPETTSTFATPVNALDSTPSDGWQMPAPDAPAAVEQPAPENEVPPPDDPWAAAPAEPAQEWQAEAASTDSQEARKPMADAVPEAAPTDWNSLRSGPDWTAPAASAEAPNDAWAPAAAETNWAPPSSDAQWSAPAAATAAEEWAAPISDAIPESQQQAAAPAAAWNAPAVGASALEQLDSEPMAAVPGAARELFGSVPAGGSLGGNDDDPGAPEELASPEEVLRPVAIDDDDPDLPRPTGEPARTRAQPLGSLRPTAVNAMAVEGEHRVAVHTRGGRTLRGTMRDVDLSKSQFPLVPQGGGQPESIYRAEVKAIFFMLAPGEPAHAGDGAKVRVTFADGRVIEGIRDGADAKHGFFLVPLDAARTNTRRIYVAREATSDIKDG